MKTTGMLKIAILIFSMTVLLSMSGCNEPTTVSGLYFDTLITITAYDNTNPQVLESCLNMCAEYELIFSKTNPASELYRINSRDDSINISKDSTVFTAVISNDLYELLDCSLQLSQETDNAFNPALGQVIDLWDYKSTSCIVPDSTSVMKALAHSNPDSIILNPDTHTLTITDPLLTIDLGGIAKGYVADRLKEMLIQNGTIEAVIRLAGNIYCIGDKYGQSYKVGIQKPFSTRGETLSSVNVSDTSVVTSGIYERYFEVNNTIYHHIIDSHTGYPSQSDLISVTIICDESVVADALSTAVLIMGKEKGIDYIDSLDNVSAVLVDSSQNVINVGF